MINRVYWIWTPRMADVSDHSFICIFVFFSCFRIFFLYQNNQTIFFKISIKVDYFLNLSIKSIFYFSINTNGGFFSLQLHIFSRFGASFLVTSNQRPTSFFKLNLNFESKWIRIYKTFKNTGYTGLFPVFSLPIVVSRPVEHRYLFLFNEIEANGQSFLFNVISLINFRVAMASENQ